MFELFLFILRTVSFLTGCIRCNIFNAGNSTLAIQVTVNMLGKLITVCVIIFVIIALRSVRRRRTVKTDIPLSDIATVLTANVPFYKKLDASERPEFESRILTFLNTTKITGVGIEVTEEDKILVAASAIIPIHNFHSWQYRNIHEVLLYGSTFNKEFETEGNDRYVLGMVGDGAMNGQMILSLPSLKSGFQRADGHNTAIHEFVHLIDKADGSVDGVPEYLLERPFIIPWVNLMRKEIAKMHRNDNDINPYGATNEAEFFAVISEYFFEKPRELKQKHPEVYAMLDEMFDGVNK